MRMRRAYLVLRGGAMRTALTRSAVACSVAALFACGSGDSSRQPVLRPLTAEEYCAALPATACRAERCERLVVRSSDDCVAQRRRECIDLFLPALRLSIAAGRASFDGATAALCIDHLDGLCANLPIAQETCARVVVGRVPPGGACAPTSLRGNPGVEECASGSCPPACPGTCPSPPPPAERPPSSPLGGACSLSAAGGNTYSFIELSPSCAAGLVCVPNDLASNQGDGTCQPLRARGEACSYSWHCGAGLTCVDGTCGDYLPEGATCRNRARGPLYFTESFAIRSSAAAPPDSGPCDAGLYCRTGPPIPVPSYTAPGVCARLPHVPGETCVPQVAFGYSLPCFGDVTCRYQGPTGAFVCSRGKEGDPCPCDPGYVCQENATCTATRPEGSACNTDDECASGYCPPSDTRVCRSCEP